MSSMRWLLRFIVRVEWVCIEHNTALRFFPEVRRFDDFLIWNNFIRSHWVGLWSLWIVSGRDIIKNDFEGLFRNALLTRNFLLQGIDLLKNTGSLLGHVWRAQIESRNEITAHGRNLKTTIWFLFDELRRHFVANLTLFLLSEDPCIWKIFLNVLIAVDRARCRCSNRRQMQA